jgi:hypothetical protein
MYGIYRCDLVRLYNSIIRLIRRALTALNARKYPLSAPRFKRLRSIQTSGGKICQYSEACAALVLRIIRMRS